MLEPDTRQLIVDALRPPAGYALEGAFGTTFSLDLVALMMAPVAFAMFDRQEADGSDRHDPIAILQALRSQAERISVFCQAGQIAVPREYRSLFMYLEESVFPTIPPKPDAIFHPKVWYLKFVSRDSEAAYYRLLCLSRNITFDRSWDTIVQLDGRPCQDLQHPELLEFGNSLIEMARRTKPVPDDRAALMTQIASEFAHAQWDLPEGFDTIRFWPLGHDGRKRNPFEGRRDRMLVISPFVTSGQLAQLTKTRWNSGSILVSRPETFDQLGGQATSHLAERLVLGSGVLDPMAEAGNASTSELTGETITSTLHGLHAKCFVADMGWKARLWTGSANCTEAAFHGNVEFLIEMASSKQRCGVDAVLGEEGNRLGLRKLLEGYVPEQLTPLPPTDEEIAEYALDVARRLIGSIPLTATCVPVDGARWQLLLHGFSPVIPVESRLDEITVHVRPATLGTSVAQQVVIDGSGFEAEFVVSEQAITPHFVFEVTLGAFTIDFLVVASLVGAPPDRLERVLSEVLKNRADVMRFLLLLLGDVEEALAAFENAWSAGSGAWSVTSGSETLLEPLVLAFARDPQRLRDIAKFIEELRKSETAADLLPEQWDDIWIPIATALLEEGRA